MNGRGVTRREAIALAVPGGLVGLGGGGQPAVSNATCDAVVALGGLILTIPHWLGKCVGIALVSGGSALKISSACSDGHQADVEIVLTEEQKQKIERALAGAQKFTVTAPKGNKQSVASRKRD